MTTEHKHAKPILVTGAAGDNEDLVGRLWSGVHSRDVPRCAGTRLVMAAIVRDLAAGKFTERVKLDGVLPEADGAHQSGLS